MFNRKIAKHAWALTWRFMIFFMMLSYPIFTQMISTMQAMSESSEPATSMNLIFFMVMNLLIPFIIPYFAMYGALSWLSMGKKNVAA